MLKFKFYITKFRMIDEDNCEEEVIYEKSDLTLLEALQKLMEFAGNHPDCHFNDRGGVELETDDASLSAIIEMEDD